MSIFKRKKSAEAEEKALAGSADIIGAIHNGWSAFPLLGGGSRERIQNIYNVAQNASYGWMYSNSPAVRTVIDLIVRSVGELDLRLFEELAEDEWQPRPDHPAALSMRYPNESSTSDNLIRGLCKDFLIHDNAYALLSPAAGGQFSISRIPAHMVEVRGSSLFEVDEYRVWPQGAWTSAGSWGGGGTAIPLDPANVFHWHGEHPHDPRVGLSRLDTLRDVIAEDAALAQAIIELANNGLQAPIWVSRPLDAPEMTDTTLRTHEEDIANRLRGRNRKPPVMVEGERLESFGTSPQDAQMMEVRRWAVERVSALYGVPPGLTLQDRWATEARVMFIEDVLAPLCKDFTSMADQRLLVRVYDWQSGRFAFNIDEKRMSDDRLTKLVSATGRPVLLTNEARAMINKPPVDGGDELITPMNVIEGNNPRPSPQIMPPQDPNKPAQNGSYRQDEGPTPIGSGADGKALTQLEDVSARLPQFHPRRAADIERQNTHIDEMSAVVQRHFKRLDRHFRTGPKRAKARTDWQRWNREFSADIEQTLGRVVQAEGDVYAMKLGGGIFDMNRAAHYLKAMAEGSASAINDTVRGEIDSLGLDQAMGRAAQHVASAGASLGARSTIWAREEAARQSPGYESRVKSWVADTDRHAEFDGATVPISADWPAGFAPGNAPGCRCSASIS